MNRIVRKLQKTFLNNLQRALLIPFISALVVLSCSLCSATNISEGAKLFKAHCALCHSLGTNKIIGPGLDGIAVRVPTPYREWMTQWIKNNISLRKSGDAYANQIFSDYNGSLMTVFDGTLNDTAISNIIAFVTSPKPDTIMRDAKVRDTYNTTDKNIESNAWIFIALIGLLLILIIILHRTQIVLQKTINEKKRTVFLETGIWQGLKYWICQHKTMFAIICISFFTLLCVYLWNYMWNIHVTPGYEPSQPINFIHKIHADDNKIPCLYCHSGADKGKVAGIPTLNVCMNCHQGIRGSNPDYQREIAKIYYAVGWGIVNSSYSNPQHPIHWNRVHSLPDFSYFNHAQHVVAGKLSCQKCHGDCSTFNTNQQFASLTMGWCIKCHRETIVQMTNGYYAALHNAITKSFGTDKKVTVADMGGLECGKCHY